MRDLKKELALLFVGTIASAIGGYYLAVLSQPASTSGLPAPWWYEWVLPVLIISVAALFTYGSGVGPQAWHRFKLWARNERIGRPFRIGIFNDMGWNQQDDESRAWTSVSPKEWKVQIETQAKESRLNVRVDLINVVKNFDSYNAVLNPYGGVYPEVDLTRLETLGKVLAYVSEGGLFVNVADVPCYYAYNSLLKRRLDTTPPIYETNGPISTLSYVPVRLFDRSPLVETLGLRVLRTSGGPLVWNPQYSARYEALLTKLGQVSAERFVVLERNVESIVKPVGPTNTATPLCLVKYGNGSFLISLVWESFPGNNLMKQALGQIVLAVLSNGWI